MKFFRGFFMAMGCFTILPHPRTEWDENARNHMLLCLPLVGIKIGVIWFLLFFAVTWLGLPTGITAAVTVIIPHFLSGFIHADGYMDCCDAIFSRREPAEKQRILKDSNVGAFAVLGAAVLFLLTFGASLDICAGAGRGELCFVLIFIPVVSRFMSTISVWGYKPMSHSQYSQSSAAIPGSLKIAMTFIGILIIAATVAVGYAVYEQLPIILITLGVEILSHAVACRMAVSELGGMSGDVSGFALSVAEADALITLAIVMAVMY